MYPTVGDAEQGTRIGGSGFLVGVFSETRPDKFYLHVVTNAHVIDAGNYVVRFNTKDGRATPVATEPAEWIVGTEDDLAVYPAAVPENADFQALMPDVFIDDTCEIDGWPIFPGDDVYLFGRFITHDGKQRNRPVVRFGNISMLPDAEATVRVNSRDQLAFLVECRSFGGFSGSPAFVKLAQPRLMDEDTRHKKGFIPLYSRFLGVDCGHLPHWSRVREKPTSQAQLYADMWTETNSGMAIIIPAWRLMRLITDDRLLRERERLDKEMGDRLAARNL
jgi:hypothetical protein